MLPHVRGAVSGDIEAIKGLAIVNGMFGPDEVETFEALFAGFLDGSLRRHRWAVAGEPGHRIEGAAYFAPEPFSDRVWNLFFIAVRPDVHRSGTGTALLAHVEQELRSIGESVARVLIVETSSTNAYISARQFYGARGFDLEATIREFYGPGDDKVVFWKSLL